MRLALLTRARVVPAFGIRRDPWLADGRIISKVFPGFDLEKTKDRDADLKAGMQRTVTELENVIRAHPDQWLWMHRRWRESDGVKFG